MINKSISPEVQEILQKSTIKGNTLTLPASLDRKLYMKVNDVIVMLGGKWDKKSKCHVFSKDIKETMASTLDSGSYVDIKQKYQSFYTPVDVARQLVNLADVKGHVVLEPSAGHGALADVCIEEGAKQVDCIDIDPDAIKVLKQRGYNTIEQDFLSIHPKNKLYSRIVMNPPFTMNSDIKHVVHAIGWLAPEGKLVSVMLANKDREKLTNILGTYNCTLTDLGPGMFKQSGTSVPTMILTVKL